MKQQLRLFLLITLFGANLDAQIKFQKWHGDTSLYQRGHSVKQTLEGGYITTGAIYITQWNIYLVKTDQFGDTLWKRTYGGDNMVGFSVQTIQDSGFVLSGYKNSSACDVILKKIDKNGNTQWTKTFGGLGCQWGQAVQQTSDKGFIIAGSGLYRTDSNGNLLWTKGVFGQAMGIRQTKDSCYIVSSYSGGTIYLNKKDSSGNTIWTKSFLGNLYNPTDHSVEQTQDGGYIFTGIDTGTTAGALLIKTDGGGNLLWRKKLGGDLGTAVVQTKDKGYSVAGFCTISGLGSQMFLVKTDSSGSIKWSNNYGFAGNEEALDFEETTDKGFVLTGLSDSFCSTTSGPAQLYLVKTDSMGVTSSLILDIQENKAQKHFVVYPNPGNGLFNAELSSESQIIITDILGHELLNERRDRGFQVFDLQNQSNGIYFVKLIQEGEQYVIKIIKE